MSFLQRLALIYFRTKFRLLSIFSTNIAASKAVDLFRTPRSRNHTRTTPIFRKAEKLQFELEGTRVIGFRWNKEATKKLLIVHGFESSIVNFHHFIQPLMDKGYSVLAFDAPAHGFSDGKTITAPMFAQMIEKIHADYGPIDSFISHSFGGLALALAGEQMKHTVPQKFVFIAPATEAKTATDQFFDLLHLSKPIREKFDILISKIGGHPIEWYSIRRAIYNTDASILWLHDADDLQTPLADALWVKHDNHPNIYFDISKGLGHRKIYRDPETVKKILAFL